MEGQYFIFWNWAVAVYLFVAGISAGAFVVSSLSYLIGEEKYVKLTRLGAYIAPFPLLLGLMALIYDLERPALFWMLLTTWQSSSVMSLGAWLLMFFSLLSFVHFYLWLPEKYELAELPLFLSRKFPQAKSLQKIASLGLWSKVTRPRLEALKGVVALIGIPVSLLVGIYTGVLLGVLTPRPFWNNPMLPLLFLVSALKTGTAAICFVGCFIKGRHGMSREEMETNKFMIHSLDLVLIVLSIIAVFLFLLGLYTSPRTSGDAAHLIMGGQFTFYFWGLAVVVGIIIPLIIELYELIPHYVRHAALREHNPWLSGAATSCVLIGALTLRFVVVYAGQTPLPI